MFIIVLDLPLYLVTFYPIILQKLYCKLKIKSTLKEASKIIFIGYKRHYCKSQPPEVFYKKRPQPATSLKKRPWHWCFPGNFAEFLRTLLLQNTCVRLLPYRKLFKILIHFLCQNIMRLEASFEILLNHQKYNCRK